MTSRNVRKKPDNALGKGLDALIRSNYLDEEEIKEKTDKTKLEKTQKIEDEAENKVNSTGRIDKL